MNGLEEVIGQVNSELSRYVTDSSTINSSKAHSEFLTSMWGRIVYPENLSVERSTIFDLVLRDLLSEFSGLSIDQFKSKVELFVDIAIVAAKTPFVVGDSSVTLGEANSIFTLLEDAFDCTSISHIEIIWDIVETRRDIFANFIEIYKSAKLSLLRVTSVLLRRLSRSLDTVLYGKIMLFLAFTLPLTERSGVNVTGEINNEEPIQYDGKQDDLKLLDLATQCKGAPDATVAADRVTLDGRYYSTAVATEIGLAYAAAEAGDTSNSSLYRAFWRLQSLIYLPSRVTQSVEAWNLYLGTMRVVLRAFETEDVKAGIAKLDISERVSRGSASTGGALNSGRKVEAEEGESNNSAFSTDSPVIPSLSALTRSPFDHLTSEAAMPMDYHARRASLRTDNSNNSHSVTISESNHNSVSTDIGKYLTSASLLSLELRDDSLRRHVLLQCLLSLQYFTVERKGSKDRPPSCLFPASTSGNATSATSSSTITSSTSVSHHPLNSIEQLRTLCLVLLRRTGTTSSATTSSSMLGAGTDASIAGSPMVTSGVALAQTVQELLQRELHWMNWKIAGANQFEKFSSVPVAGDKNAEENVVGGPNSSRLTLKRALGAFGKGYSSLPSTNDNDDGDADNVWERKRHKWMALGRQEHMLEQLLYKERKVKPNLDTFLLPLRVAADERAGIQDEYSPANDALYLWRGHRLIAELAGEEKWNPFCEGKHQIGVHPTSFTDSVMDLIGVKPHKKELPPPEGPSRSSTENSSEMESSDNMISSEVQRKDEAPVPASPKEGDKVIAATDLMQDTDSNTV